MENLRWILLIAGVALIALVYWNSRRRNAMGREQPPIGDDGSRPPAAGHAQRREPKLSDDDLDDPLFAPTPSWRFDEASPPPAADKAAAAGSPAGPEAGRAKVAPVFAPPVQPPEPPPAQPVAPSSAAPVGWEIEPLVHDATPDATAERADADGPGEVGAAERNVEPFGSAPAYEVPDDEAMPDFDWAPLEAAEPPREAAEPESSAARGADGPVDDDIPPPIEYDPAQPFAPRPGVSAQPLEEHFDAEPQSLGSVEEKLVLLHVVAADGRGFAGPALRQLFAERGYQHGEMQIYHSCYEDKTVFSIVNLVEPGYFEPQRMDETFHTPGVTLFMRLPGPLPADVAFDVLVSEAQQMASELGGEARDAEHATLTRQRIQHLREEVQDYILRNRLGGKY